MSTNENVPTSENTQSDTDPLKKLHSKVYGGIVAAGIAEAGQPESLTFLNEDDWTVPESGEKPEQSWSERMDQMAKEVAEIAEQGRPVYGTVLGALHEVNAKNNHFIEQLKECIEEKDATIEALVSPPPQESQSSLLNEIQHLLYSQGPIVGREEVLEKFTITRKKP